MAAIHNDRSLGYAITTDGAAPYAAYAGDGPNPGQAIGGQLELGGINNTYFWIDPARNVGGVILMQFLPFADTKALAAYDAFERGVYRTLADGAAQ